MILKGTPFERFWSLFAYRDQNPQWFNLGHVSDNLKHKQIKQFEEDGLIFIHGSYNNLALFKISYTEKGLALGEMYDL